MEADELELEVELIQRFETRLENIEEKIEVLKKPIQQTLLDIQEQITSYYSPSRGAGGLESAPSYEEEDLLSEEWDEGNADLSPKAEEYGRRLTSPIGTQAPSVSGEETSTLPSVSADLIAKVKQVTLEDIRGLQGRPSFSPEEEMVDWAYSSIAKIGQAYTRQAVETCAKGRSLLPQTTNSLLQLVSRGHLLSQMGAETPSGQVELAEILGVLTNLNAALDRDPNLEEALVLMSD